MYYLRSDGKLFYMWDCSNPAAFSIHEKYQSIVHAGHAIWRCIHTGQKKAGGYGWKVVDVGNNCLREHKTTGFIYF